MPPYGRNLLLFPWNGKSPGQVSAERQESGARILFKLTRIVYVTVRFPGSSSEGEILVPKISLRYDTNDLKYFSSRRNIA